jgi:RNA polymerase sigma-70 factor (ECF subfamily)
MMVTMERVDMASATASVPSDFIAAYRRTLGEVYSYLVSRVGDTSTAEDLTQEVYIAAARRFAAGDPIDVAWLIAVSRHKLVDHWRARAREERKLALVQTVTTGVDEDMPAIIDASRATSALAQLNPTYRAALVLRHVDGLSVPEVASQLGRTIEATEQVLARARVAFRRVYLEAAS